MRLVITLMLGVLLGVLAGRLGPATELAKVEQALAEAQAQPDCETRTLGRDLANLMKTGLPGDRRRAPPPEPDERLEQDLAEAEESAEELRREAREDLREGLSDDTELDAARAALDLRRAQARASLVEDADPSDEQLGEIDSAVADMNDALEVLAQDLDDLMEDGQDPSRRDAMVFVAEALDTMIVAEDRIWDSLSPEQQGDVEDGAVDPFSHVDSGIIDVLAELGDAG